MSMSITDFMALGERWVMGARKLPAAPALEYFHGFHSALGFLRREERVGWDFGRDGGVHHVIDSSELFHASLHCRF